MPLEKFHVSIFPTAQIDCDERMLFLGGDIAKHRRINCFAFLLENKRSKVLVDTGILDLDSVNRTKKGSDQWRRENGDAIVLQFLERKGIRPEDIDEIVLTHGHYDHASCAILFPKARIYLQKKEWDAIYSIDNPMRKELMALQEYLISAEKQGRVILLEGENVSQSGVRLIPFSGHTVGSQMAEAITQHGNTLFTGDSIFMLANIDEGLPIGFAADAEGARKALIYCQNYDGAILTGHDPLCMHQ